jgi:hypothetical protein
VDGWERKGSSMEESDEVSVYLAGCQSVTVGQEGSLPSAIS